MQVRSAQLAVVRIWTFILDLEAHTGTVLPCFTGLAHDHEAWSVVFCKERQLNISVGRARIQANERLTVISANTARDTIISVIFGTLSLAIALVLLLFLILQILQILKRPTAISLLSSRS
jgi:hypothetical protein